MPFVSKAQAGKCWANKRRNPNSAWDCEKWAKETMGLKAASKAQAQEMTDFLPLLIAGLATFRLAVLVSEDDGPSRIFQKFRSMLKREAKVNPTLRKSAIHQGIECIKCSGVWIALPIALFMFWREDAPEWLRVSGDVFLAWMSLSALAILFNRAFPKR